jgi:hypothetical protein
MRMLRENRNRFPVSSLTWTTSRYAPGRYSTPGVRRGESTCSPGRTFPAGGFSAAATGSATARSMYEGLFSRSPPEARTMVSARRSAEERARPLRVASYMGCASAAGRFRHGWCVSKERKTCPLPTEFRSDTAMGDPLLASPPPKNEMAGVSGELSGHLWAGSICILQRLLDARKWYCCTGREWMLGRQELSSSVLSCCLIQVGERI